MRITAREMIFTIHPMTRNPRRHYQQQVENLCKLLKDKKGKDYRYHLFMLLSTVDGHTAKNSLSRQGRKKFRDLRQVKPFREHFPSDERALQILQELDDIYATSPTDTDNLRGAVGEVFAYRICEKIYPHSGIESKVQIDSWMSDLIDAVGCNDKKGHCLQSKCGGKRQTLGNILRQKLNLDKIQDLTSGKAEGFFITFNDQQAFTNLLGSIGLDTKTCNVLGRTELVELESILMS